MPLSIKKVFRNCIVCDQPFEQLSVSGRPREVCSGHCAFKRDLVKDAEKRQKRNQLLRDRKATLLALGAPARNVRDLVRKDAVYQAALEELSGLK